MAGNEEDELIGCLCHWFYDSFLWCCVFMKSYEMYEIVLVCKTLFKCFGILICKPCFSYKYISRL